MSKYNKNFILCGDIDHYCLLCKEFFLSIPDVERHIRWEKHRKTMKNQDYFPKFKRDRMFKIANRFYCEICNYVSSDIATATRHKNSEKHMALKNNAVVQPKNFTGQYDSGYVVINKIIINMAQWNSVVDNKCHVCDIDVVSVDEHLSSEEHTIKLIQSETTYEDDRYYRKVKGDKYHCFTCKKVFDADKFHDHWSCDCENIDNIELKKLKQAGSSRQVGTIAQDIEKKLINTLGEYYFVDEKINSATCKYCGTVVAINFKTMIEHMKTQHETQETKAKKNEPEPSGSSENTVYAEIPDYGKRRSELAKYGKEHSIKLNHNGSKGWCLICDKYLAAHKNNFKAHIEGAIHSGHLELQGLINPRTHSEEKYKSKNISQFTFTYERRTRENSKPSTFRTEIDCSINVFSLFLLFPIQGNPHFKKVKCYACNILFPQGQEREHCESTMHKDVFMAANVLELEETPVFIREIRPNLFHCGSCNMTLPFPENLEKHMMTYNHMQTLMEANLRINFKFGMEPEPSYLFDSVKIPVGTEDLYGELLRYGFEKL